MQTLHGYTVDETQWKSKGGGGQCNIAKKGGKEYFIKRLAFPRYPDSDNFKGAFKQQKIDICNDWYRRRQEIIRAIPGSGTGTTVKPIEYFREGPCYYEVANLIDVTSIPYDEIYKESKEDKARVMLTVAMSLADLHKKGIVHGDLDPRNILISRVAGSKNLVTKLIDFSDSFFENDIHTAASIGIARRQEQSSHSLYEIPEVYRSVLPYFEICQGKCTHLELLPVELGMDRENAEKNIPYVADEKTAEKIAEYLTRVSKRYGTEWEYKEGRIVLHA